MKTNRSHKGWAFALALAVTLLLTGGALAAEYAAVYNTSNLNMRTGPGTEYERIGNYARGAWMEILGESGNWYYVRSLDGKKTGYMSKNYLSTGASSATTVGIVNNPKATSWLNLREYPSTDAKVLGIYYNGAIATILSRYDNTWYHVSVNGLQGYMMGSYLKITTSAGEGETATIVTPNSTRMNLRAAPSLNAQVVRQFAANRQVIVLQKGNDFWKVSIDGYTGFMMDDFLQTGSSGGSTGTTGGTAAGGSAIGSAVVKNPRSTQVLNLRAQPSTSAKVLGQYRNGVRLDVLAQGSKWCKVRTQSGGIVGYMMTQYLTLYDLPATPYKAVTHPNQSYVNLRSGPSKTNEVYARMPHGSLVTVVTPGAEWCQVKYNGQTGYAMTAFLK